MPLKKLPVELLLEIPTHLGSFRNLAALTRTCRLFYDLFNSLLYKYDVQTGSPIAMFWAARWGNLQTLQLSHAAGANLKQAWTQRVPLMRAKILEPWKVDESGDYTTKIYKEMGRHSGSTYVRLFHDIQDDESDSESLTDSETDESSSSEDDESSDESDDDQRDIRDDWKENPDGLKTASESNTYTFGNLILKPDFESYANRCHPYPKFWWHPLDLAVHFGHRGIIEYLLDSGVTVQESHSRGLCPFGWCHGSVELLGKTKVVPGLPYASMMGIHHPIILAACPHRSDLDMQKFLLRKVGLHEMAERLTLEEVEDHHYMFGSVAEDYSCAEANILMDFQVWNAGVSGQASR